MPGFNRTGPKGEGPRTGRGLGKCNPETKDDQFTDDNRPARRGQRFMAGGRGSGKGRGNDNRHRNKGN